MPIKITVHSYKNEPFFENIFFVFNDEDEGTIGRNFDNSLVLEDTEKFVSKTHAKIIYLDDNFYLVNLSVNGTFFKSKGISLNVNEKSLLNNNDIFSIGEYDLLVSEFTFKDNVDDSASPIIRFTDDNPFEYTNHNEHESNNNLTPNIHYDINLNTDDWSQNEEISISNVPVNNDDWYQDSEDNSNAKNSDWLIEPGANPNSNDDGWGSSPIDPPIDNGCTNYLKLEEFDKNITFLCDTSKKNEWKIGRHEDNDLVLSEKIISGSHATISFEQGEFYLTDHSTNGLEIINHTTKKNVNNIKIKIKDHDKIVIGNYNFAVSFELKTTTPPLDPPNLPNSSFDFFFESLGIDSSQFSSSQKQQVVEKAGNLFRNLVQGLVNQLQAREDFKRSLPLPDKTYIGVNDNNLLKVNASIDDIILSLFLPKSGFLDAHTSINSAFNDIALHQSGILKGFESSIVNLITQFDPVSLEKKYCSDFAVLKNAKCWDVYCVKYPMLKDEAMDNILGTVFAEAYRASHSKNLDS